MSDCKMILELNLTLNQDEQKKLLHFLDSELCIEKEDVRIKQKESSSKQQALYSKKNTAHKETA